MNQCSICLNNVKQTRSTRELPCKHIFHGACINKWKETGHKTCPVCRKLFDCSKFKVTVKIENLENSYSQLMTANPLDSINILNEVSMLFEPDTNDDLQSILNDVGLSISDLDALIFNTE